MNIWPMPEEMVCGVENTALNSIASSEAAIFDAWMASRRLQSESQTPSFVSAVFVTVKVAATANVENKRTNRPAVAENVARRASRSDAIVKKTDTDDKRVGK
jgi:hypothetical protein